MREADALLARGELGSARKAYNRVWHECPVSKAAPEAVYQSGHISMLRGEWKKALEYYNLLLTGYPESPHFNDVIADIFDIASAYEEGRNIHFLWFIPYKDAGKAIMAYEALAVYAPYSDYAPTALLRVAMLHKRDRETVAAMDALDRIINNYPDSMVAADATMLMAEYLTMQVAGPEYDQGATREAMSYYRDFLTLYPGNPAVAECEKGLAERREILAQSRLVLGRFFYDYRDDYDAAAVFFNDTITIAPESNSATEARDYLAKVDAIKARFPEGNWPRRTDWQFLMYWREWDPMTMPVPPPTPAPEAAPTAGLQ
jgi:outer membrane protein assembly factor BamD